MEVQIMKKLEEQIRELVELHNRNEEIVKLRLQGKTYQEIGDRFGITKARVHMIIKRYEKEAKAGRI